MPTEKENTATMQEALRSLNEVSSNIATPKTIKKNITDMVADLTNGQYSISVRAANSSISRRVLAESCTSSPVIIFSGKLFM